MSLFNFNNITNPIFFTLLKLNLIKEKNIIKISNSTRDHQKNKVYLDVKSKIFFNEKNINKNYYENKPVDRSGSYSVVKMQNFSQKTIPLDDDLRRFEHFKKFIKNKKILDYGCGWGAFLELANKISNCSGVEIREKCIMFIKSKLKKIRVENNINYFHSKFDVITLFHVLEHLENPIAHLKNIKTFLNPRGKLIIEVPSAVNILLELKQFRKFSFWSEHLVLHTKKSLHKFIKDAGYKKVKIYYYQRYSLDNHIQWLLKEHKIDITMHVHDDDYLNFLYKDKLVKAGRADTLKALISV
jgi:2-polyprenyl-3-methyl-5-hydroxy-6-metoxy-1,4-benzoquinol methylase